MRDFFAALQLERRPANRLLQAYDSADNLALNHLHSLVGNKQLRVLVINDHFGALGVAISKYFANVQLVSSSDSKIAQLCLLSNLAANQISQQPTFIDSMHLAAAHPHGSFDILLGKLPKQLDYLQQQIDAVAQLITPQTHIILATIDKHTPKNLENTTKNHWRRIGQSRGYKKAHLQFYRQLPAPTANSPAALCGYKLERWPIELMAYSNVFCRRQLDLGARFMLDNFAKLPAAARILDLACGNGVLGIVAKLKNPKASISFCDESFMAIASAQLNFSKACQQLQLAATADFHVADGIPPALANYELILLNPPFHQHFVVGDFIARELVQAASHALAANGSLWLVGNRHLQYQQLLQRHFAKVQLVASNTKFVLLSAQLPKQATTGAA